jgi:hypothetical protein
MSNSVATSFLGLAAGAAISNLDDSCRNLRSANAMNQLGERAWAIGILCESPEIKNAVGAKCPVAPSPAAAQAQPVAVPVAQVVQAPLPTLPPAAADPPPAFSPGMTTDQLNSASLMQIEK